MFTGLIEETGILKKKTSSGGGTNLTIAAKVIMNNLAIGDSININGTCQTVVSFDRETFTVTAVEETLKKTNLGSLQINEAVNLESSLTLNKKLGGHIVLGHVDGTGAIAGIKKLQTSYLVKVSYPKEFAKYLINVGAVAVNGVSLTVAEFDDKTFTVSVIPHTWDATNFGKLAAGAKVNLEFDVLGKYVERILGLSKEDKGLTEGRLKELGFL
jgi:riboflavin synthase